MDWTRFCEEWLLGVSLCNRIEMPGARGQIILDNRNKRRCLLLLTITQQSGGRAAEALQALCVLVSSRH